MKIQLSDHFDYGRLIRFILPSIVMMIFTSIYGVVDGFFISNFAGKNSFAAINLIMPAVMAFGSVGFMLGSGGSALVSKTLGQGNREKANQYFTMLIKVIFIIASVFSTAAVIFMPQIAKLLGATDVLIDDCVTYGRIIMVAQFAFMLQNNFQSFFVVAEKPKMGLMVTIGAGVTNMVLDLLFVAVFGWGVAGAAAATALSQCVGGIVPIIYFTRKNSSLLRIVPSAKIELKQLLKVCGNGSSEMLTNISISLVNMLYNLQLLKYAAEDGVAAYGIIMYVNFIFISVFIGYSIGCAPVIGYNYGAERHDELKNVFGKSIKFICCASLLLTAVAEIFAPLLANLFVGYDAELSSMTCRGFRLYSVSFLFIGTNIYASSFFTALNNGAISALISFLRTLVFQIAAIFILPIFLGLDGIWLALVSAEFLTIFISIMLIRKKRACYGY